MSSAKQRLTYLLKQLLLTFAAKFRYMLLLSGPNMSGNEWKYVKDCLDTGWVSSVGAYVDQFEKITAEFAGTKYAVALSWLG